jgi:hypothetical protein
MLRYVTAYVDASQQAYEQKYRDRMLTNLQRKARVFGYQLVQVEDPGSAQAAATLCPGEVPWKSRKPLTGSADGGEQGDRCALLTSGSGARYPSTLWYLGPVWKSGVGRRRPRRWCRPGLLPQGGVDPGGQTAFPRPSPARCPRVSLSHSGGYYAATQARLVPPRPGD